MAAERFSAPFIRQLALPNLGKLTPGYYRSKLFIASFSKNSLVAAAGPILSLLERLCVALTLPPINELRKNIEHELQAFHSRLNEQAYVGELDALAYYLLCATIDEILGKNYLRLYGKAVNFQAFTPSSHLDEIGPEKQFFNIVNFIKEEPNQYLDLIELAYYCLITGFEGEQHGRTEGRQLLDNLIEELYQLIKKHRVNKFHRLFQKNKHLEIPTAKSYKSIILGSLLTVVVISCTCFISHHLLTNKVNAIQLAYKSSIVWDSNE